MAKLKVNINIKQAVKALSTIKSIVPKVNAITINKLALDSQEAIRENMAKKFIQRRNLDKWIKIKPFATPSSQKATVAVDPPGGQKNDVLSQHEFGGRKTAQGGDLAIPTTDIRPDIKRIVTRRNRPKNLKRSFTIISRSGKRLIARRKNKNTITFPYVLVSDVPIKKQLNLVKITQEIVAKGYVAKWERVWRKETGGSFF